MINNRVIPSKPSATGYNIEQSLRFNDDDSAYLSKVFASAPTERKKLTMNFQIKQAGDGGTGYNHLTSVYKDSNNYAFFRINSDKTLEFYEKSAGTVKCQIKTNAVFRDKSAHMNIHIEIDTTLATATDRVKIYINGDRITSFSAEITFPLNQGLVHGYGDGVYEHNIGQYAGGGAYHFDGYMSEFHFIGGLALDPSYFGELDATYGHWKPIAYNGTYGTNGFYLDFANPASIGADSSGNGNNFAATNLSATDVVLDSPTNNYATWNTLLPTTSVFSEGNLYGRTSSSTDGNVVANTAMESGNWYAEFYIHPNSIGAGGFIGITDLPKYSATNANGSSYSVMYAYNGNLYDVSDGSSRAITYGATFTEEDIISVAFNVATNSITFYKNGVSQGSHTLDGTLIEMPVFVCGDAQGSNYMDYVANFGQDSSFAGNKTAQGNTDDNGIGDFYYAPPSGYLALCTANLPEPTVVPSEHFNVVLDTGANIKSTAESEFTYFLEWIKDRANSNNHQLADTVRGTSAILQSNTTTAETTYTTPSGSSVAWVWNASQTAVTNTDGTITSTVSANVDAGFSIVGFTGTINVNDTVGHGLLKAPELIINKFRSTTSNWDTHTTAIDGSLDYLSLNTNIAKINIDSYALPTSTVFTTANDSTATKISYCFHSVEGYSKIGSYIGNGSADGTFVYCNHKPKYIMIKRTDSTSNWTVIDIEREGYNVDNDPLYPNLSNAEGTTDLADIISNGFKLRTTDASVNASGGTYIFYSVAEHPFKYSNAR